MTHFYNKSAIALTAGLLLSGGAMANSGVTVYGKINASFQSDDVDDVAKTNVKSNASRFGVKGKHSINSSLTAIYKLEWQVDVADDENDNFKARSQWVGLKGDFGTVLLGRNDSMLKSSQGKIDLFNDLNADLKNMFNGDNRLDDTLSYLSPSMKGFSIGATVIAQDNKKSDGETGTSLALMYGDSSLKRSALYASVALDSDVAGRNTTRVTVNGKLGDFKLGAMFNTSEKVDGTDDGDGFLVNVAYTIDKTTLKAQYQDSDDKVQGTGLSLGVDYKLAKTVKLYAFYTDFSLDNGSDSSHLAVGMEYKF